jgi:hypothetical protein
MKPSRILLLWTLFALLPAGLRADTVAYEDVVNGVDSLTVLNSGAYAAGDYVDPEVVVRRLKRGSIPFEGFIFEFNSDSGTGFFDYRNNNDVALLDLTLVITGVYGDANMAFGCGIQTQLDALPFSSCVYRRIGTGTTDSSTVITFFGAAGLPAQSHFAILLTGFPADATVLAQAIPEASSPAPPPSASPLTPAPESSEPTAVKKTEPDTASVPEPETLPLLLIGVLAIATGRLLRKYYRPVGGK